MTGLSFFFFSLLDGGLQRCCASATPVLYAPAAQRQDPLPIPPSRCAFLELDVFLLLLA